MPWPRDDAKLERVRSLMADAGLDAIVARAPDNVLYLTNFWGMKGWDAVVFPRVGEPTLFCVEASADDAARTAWTTDVRLVDGYLAGDPRPPVARTLELAAALAREHGTVGLELSLGTQAADRMVGEPTTFTKAWFDAFPGAVDATPALGAARTRKTAQEIERMRLANEIAAAAISLAIRMRAISCSVLIARAWARSGAASRASGKASNQAFVNVVGSPTIRSAACVPRLSSRPTRSYPRATLQATSRERRNGGRGSRSS